LSNFCDNKIFFYFFFAICNFQYIFAPHLNRKNKKMKKISFAMANDSNANDSNTAAAPVAAPAAAPAAH